MRGLCTQCSRRALRPRSPPAAPSPLRSAAAMPPPRSPRGARSTTCPGSEASPSECWSSHASATCIGVASCAFATSAERVLPDAAGVEREPGDEAEPLLLAGLQHRLGVARRGGVAVLHRHDRHDLLRLLDVLDAHVGQADVADLALVSQVGQRAHGLLERAPSGRACAAGTGGSCRASGAAGSSQHRFRRSGRQSGSQRPGPGRVRPPLVAITRSCGYGCRASAISCSLTLGP